MDNKIIKVNAPLGRVMLFFALIAVFSLIKVQALNSESGSNSFVELNGNGDMLIVNDSDSLDGFSEATWNIWIREKQFKDSALFAKDGSYLIQTYLADGIAVNLSNGEKTETTYSNKNSKCGVRINGEWTMITIAYSGSVVRYYRNGVLCDSEQTSISTLANSANDLNIGGTEGMFFNGSIAEVKIYSKELKKEQIQRLYDESPYGRDKGQSIPNLVYHQIENPANSKDKVALEDFKAQIDILNSSGFKTITTEQYNQWKKGSFSMPEKAVMIQFDDGWDSIYTRAEPVMSKYGFVGTEFIVIRYANDFTNYMDWARIQGLMEKGWDIESHGMDHIRMLELNETDFRDELNNSKFNLKENLNLSEEPKSFVFPFYSTNQTYTNICAEYYDLCWTWANEPNNPSYNYKSSNGHLYKGVSRITITNDMDLNAFKSLLGNVESINGEWKMNEVDGNVVKDSSSRKNDAVLSNGASLGNEPGVGDEPPKIFVPANLSYEATSPDGAVVQYKANASDKIDGTVLLTCEPKSNTLFGFGKNIVECGASDSSGNNASAFFEINVEDKTPPKIIISPNLIISDENLSVSLNATAYDAASPDLSNVTWDFGDESGNEEGESVIHSYTDAGTYRFNAKVKDSRENEGVEEGIVVVGNMSAFNYSSKSAPDVLLSFTELPKGAFSIRINENSSVSSNMAGFSNGSNFFEIISDLPNGSFNTTITLFYKDSNNNGVVDGTKVNESQLGIYFYNGNTWTALENVNRDLKKNKISANLNHFTLFALLAPASSAPPTLPTPGPSGDSGGSSGSSGGGGGSRGLVDSETPAANNNSSSSLNNSSNLAFTGQNNNLEDLSSGEDGNNISSISVENSTDNSSSGVQSITGAVIGAIGRDWKLAAIVLVLAVGLIGLLVRAKSKKVE